MDSNSEGGITIVCQCMLFIVIRGVVSIIIVIALICMEVHHCVMSLKEASSLVQKEGLVACHKFRRGLGAQKGMIMGVEGGPGSLREPNVSWYHMYNVTMYRESHYIYLHIIINGCEIMVILVIY